MVVSVRARKKSYVHHKYFMIKKKCRGAFKYIVVQYGIFRFWEEKRWLINASSEMSNLAGKHGHYTHKTRTLILSHSLSLSCTHTHTRARRCVTSSSVASDSAARSHAKVLIFYKETKSSGRAAGILFNTSGVCFRFSPIDFTL